MKERETTPQSPYLYTLAGLPHVGLVGIVVRECSACAGIIPVIPRVGELHRVIADALVRKAAPLTGAEVRFLRKNAGFQSRKFAALIGVDPAHLSRVEHGKAPRLGAPADRLARAVVTAEACGGEDARKVLLQAAEERIKQKANRRSTFKLEKNRWKPAA